jgi:hypothetical protein
VRINEPPPVNVSRGDAGGPASVVPATAVNPVAPGSYPGGRVVAETGENPPAPFVQPIVDRRARLRRAGDRRQQQVPVTIDTRVSQRRTTKRRAADQPPQAVNVQV